jgi:uncharacterized protein (TIGR00251 family)
MSPLLAIIADPSCLCTQMAEDASCTLEIRVVPNAPRNAVVGWHAGALKVKVHAPALEGRANDELCEFLAGELGLPRRAVTLLRGDKSRQKVLRIAGLHLAAIQSRFPAA